MPCELKGFRGLGISMRAMQRSNADADAALSVCEREIKETQ